MERVDFRTKRIAHFVSLANSSVMTFSFRSSYVWSITLTTNSQRAVRRKTGKECGAEMNELIKIEHLVDERRCMMER
jgi:hypothetical protein